MSQVQYPDSVYREAPADGYYFYHDGQQYKWDSYFSGWFNARGVRWMPLPVSEQQWESDGGGQAVTTAAPTPEKDLKEFFFGKNTEGCECGSWSVGATTHSSFCKLYSRN